MKPLPLFAALLLVLGLPGLAHGARFTYHGDLLDGSAPAQGAYDLRVRSYANNGATSPLGEATELPAVAIEGGRFAVDLDLPEDADGITWVEVAVRRSGSGEDYLVLGAPQPLAKVNSTCPGAWALDGNASAPAGSYLGHADSRSLFLAAPNGVAVNSLSEIAAGSGVDLLVKSKAGDNVDGNADLLLQGAGASGKSARIAVLNDASGDLFVQSTEGGIEFRGGLPTATRNSGQEVHDFDGRLRSRAVGSAPGDTSGGLWFDDERARAAFVGRGINSTNWTGFFTNDAGWTVVAPDTGGLLVNRTDFFDAARDDMVVGARSSGDADANLTLISRDGLARTSLIAEQVSGDFIVQPIGVFGLPFPKVVILSATGVGRRPTANAFEISGDASKATAGAWLANSDRRIKTAIAPIPRALDTIMALRPVTFRYTADYRAKNAGIADQRYYNVIAQEFAEVFPEAVKGSGEYLPGLPKTAANEILQVDTYPAQITALAAIQELAMQDAALSEQLADAKAENAALRASLDALLVRVSQLEAQRER